MVACSCSSPSASTTGARAAMCSCCNGTSVAFDSDRDGVPRRLWRARMGTGVDDWRQLGIRLSRRGSPTGTGSRSSRNETARTSGTCRIHEARLGQTFWLADRGSSAGLGDADQMAAASPTPPDRLDLLGSVRTIGELSSPRKAVLVPHQRVAGRSLDHVPGGPRRCLAARPRRRIHGSTCSTRYVDKAYMGAGRRRVTSTAADGGSSCR